MLVDRGVGGIDVAEDLARCVELAQLFVASMSSFGAQLFALVAIEDAQRDSHAEADVGVDGRIAAEIKPKVGSVEPLATARR